MQISPPPSSASAGRKKLKTAAKAAVLVGVVVGVGIQFIPVKGVGDNPTARFKIDAPPEVEAIMRKACYDCHSNETRWPWYAKLAPSSWLMARDVLKGRSRMNISEWGDADESERMTDRENSRDQVDEGNMPPWFYLPMHPEAKLSTQEKDLLRAWLVPPKTEKKAEEPKTAEEPPKKEEKGKPMEAAAIGAAAAGAAGAATAAATAAPSKKNRAKGKPRRQSKRRR
jgi:hypothetical protein